MSNIFSIKTVSYNLRNGTTFHCRDAYTVLCESETTSFLSPNIWALLNPKMRNIKYREGFKKKIRECTPNNCLCRLCKIFIQIIGFL